MDIFFACGALVLMYFLFFGLFRSQPSGDRHRVRAVLFRIRVP